MSSILDSAHISMWGSGEISFGHDLSSLSTLELLLPVKAIGGN